MIIEIGNLPANTTIKEIKQLLPHSAVESVRSFVSSPPEKTIAWVTINVQNRNWANKLAQGLKGRVHQGRVLEASTLLFFSH